MLVFFRIPGEYCVQDQDKTKTDYVHTETDSRPRPNKPLKQKHHTSPGSQVIPACHVFEIPLTMLYAKTKTKNVKTKTTEKLSQVQDRSRVLHQYFAGVLEPLQATSV